MSSSPDKEQRFYFVAFSRTESDPLGVSFEMSARALTRDEADLAAAELANAHPDGVAVILGPIDYVYAVQKK